MQSGTSVESALAACTSDASLAETVCSLISAAEAVQADAIAPPVMNGALETRQKNLLAAAVVAYEAEAETLTVEAKQSELAQEDALDQALMSIRDGASVDEVIAAAAVDSSFGAVELRRMVMAAEALRNDIVPTPSRSLDAGRERMLQVAAQARDHQRGHGAIARH